jgi:hypothetical protein
MATSPSNTQSRTGSKRKVTEFDGYGNPIEPKGGEVVEDDLLGAADSPEETPTSEVEEVVEPKETKPVVATETAPRRRGRQPKPPVDTVEHNLDPADLILMHEAQRRDWKTQRATLDEKISFVRIGTQLTQLGSTNQQIAKSFGISTLTYANWKEASGKAPAPKGRPPKPETKGRKDAEDAATRVLITQSRYMAKIDLAPIVAENRRVVIELLCIGKEAGIKRAIIGLIEEA